MSKTRQYLAGGLAALALLALAVAVSAAPVALFSPIMKEYPRLTTWVDNRVLAAGVAETVTVPTACDFMIFGANGIFYLRSGGAAAVPGADVTDGSGVAVSPSARRVTPAATFSIIAPAATIVSMECYTDGGSISD